MKRKFLCGYVLFVLLLCGSARAADYGDAYAQALAGKPLVVVCGAPWCVHCHALDRELEREGITHVYAESGPVYGLFYAPGQQIPQTSVYLLSGGRWHVRRPLIGNIHARGLLGVIRELQQEGK